MANCYCAHPDCQCHRVSKFKVDSRLPIGYGPTTCCSICVRHIFTATVIADRVVL